MSKTQKIFTENGMRKLLENQLKIGQTDIPNIKIDIECRDEIPQVLMGLQTIYSDKVRRRKVFNILTDIIPGNIDKNNGRPGMDLWKILVLGVLRLNCNWDYDKLHNMANNHKTIREFLGHTIYDFDRTYSLQAIKDNISLFTPELLDKINQIVVDTGHKRFCVNNTASLNGRCDSFVVETDVHFPTDINLLLDAVRKILFILGAACLSKGITEWRQHLHIFKKIKKQYRILQKLKRSTSKDKQKKALREKLIIDAHRQYLNLVESQVKRAEESIGILKDMGVVHFAKIIMVENFIHHTKRQMDQIRRRVINGETIPHAEKVFSIFEPHTEWISKGKAGVLQELGLMVSVLEDQHGFILHHHVMEHQKDVDVALKMTIYAKRKFPNLESVSFDKGFYSPANRDALKELIKMAVLPKKGRKSKKDQETESAEEFVTLRRKHSAVESAINALENHGLDRCPDHGIDGFKRYVSLAVLARNIQVLGALQRQTLLKKEKRKNRLAA